MNIQYNLFLERLCNGDINLYTSKTSALESILHYCKLNNNFLLDMLLIVYNDIVITIRKLLQNNTINGYIHFLIHQWNYEIKDLHKLFIKGDTNINYKEFVNNCEEYDDIDNNIKQLNNYITSKNYELNGQIKDNIFLLNENIDTLIKDINNYKNKLEIFKNKVQLNYNLLLDISSKNKSDYINYIKTNTLFNKLIVNNTNIPDNINVIFLNYILINNMIQKEINYILHKINITIDNLKKYNFDLNEVIQNIEIIT